MVENFSELSQQPIPIEAGRIPEGWREVPVLPNQDPLVPIGPYATVAADIYTTGVYAGEHPCSPYFDSPIDGATVTTFLRKSIAMRLSAMQNELPPNHFLLVFDGYRGARTQTALYNSYLNKLRELHPELPLEKLHAETQNYVSLPSAEPPSPHRTGGAVDMAVVKFDNPTDGKRLRDVNARLCDLVAATDDNPMHAYVRDGQERLRQALFARSTMLDFGTPFDHGTKKASIDYYENLLERGVELNQAEQDALQRRRAWYTLALRHGFIPYAEEWWHLDPVESQRGGAAAGRTEASLGAVELTPEHSTHEGRRQLLAKAALLAPSGKWPIERIAPQL